MFDYKVEYSYERDGKRVYDSDVVYCCYASEAVEEIREYEDRPVRIERVYRLVNGRYEEAYYEED